VSDDRCSDLGLLKRDRKLQERYDIWVIEVKKKYGSVGKKGLL
jgi:hypothetical protein